MKEEIKLKLRFRRKERKQEANQLKADAVIKYVRVQSKPVLNWLLWSGETLTTISSTVFGLCRMPGEPDASLRARVKLLIDRPM